MSDETKSAEAKFDEVDKKIAALEDKRQTQTPEFLQLLREKLALSEELKRFSEVNNCEMRIRFIEARMRGEEMPHTEYVNLERKARRKTRNRVNMMLFFFVALFVIMCGSIPIIQMMIQHKQQVDEEILGAQTESQAPTQAADSNVEEINAETGGQTIQLEKFLAPGRTTIFDFWSVNCPSCVRSMPIFKRLAAIYPNIKCYSVDVDRPFSSGIDWESPVCAQFNIKSLPHYRIYEGTQLSASGTAANERLRELMNKAPHH